MMLSVTDAKNIFYNLTPEADRKIVFILTAVISFTRLAPPLLIGMPV